MSIEIQNCKNCIIENNKVGGNERWSVFSYGILIYDSKNITVKHNQISKASTGIEISSSKPVYVIQNNFVRNFRKSRFDSDKLSSIIWDGNYWGRPRIFPKIIFGIFTIIPTTFLHPGLFLLLC